MSSTTLNLFFPQWQGAAQYELYEGANLLFQELENRTSFQSVPVSLTYSLEPTHNILGHHQLLTQLRYARQMIENRSPDRIVTLGGDCGVEIAPVSFMKARYQDELAILWLDAHADLNTPQSSPSRHFHGMPLRTLLGEGDDAMTEQAFSALQPEQVCLAGVREWDEPELSFAEDEKLTVFSADALMQRGPEPLVGTLKAANFNQLYIHLDLDVLEPQAFPHVTCPTPGGLSPQVLVELLQHCDRAFEMVGLSVLEFFPRGPVTQGVQAVVNLMAQANLPLHLFDKAAIAPLEAHQDW